MPYTPPSSGGGSQTLAQTLALGNDANGLNIVNLADPVNPQDALTLHYWTVTPAPSAITSTYATFESTSTRPILYQDASVNAFSSAAGFFITYDLANPGNALQATNANTATTALNATNATNDINGLEIDTNYLLLNGEADNTTVSANTLESYLANGSGNPIAAFAFDPNFSTNGSGQLGANSLTLNAGPLAFGASSASGLIGDGFIAGIGSEGNIFGDASLVTFKTLPTSDPGVAGSPWNNLGILTISSG